MYCSRLLRTAILLLTLPAISLPALELYDADRDLLLLREARPWLQDRSDGMELLPFDLIGSGRALQLRHGQTVIHLAPDSLLLIEQVDDDILVLRLLSGSVSFGARSPETGPDFAIRAADLTVDVTGTSGEIQLSHAEGVRVTVSEGIAFAMRDAHARESVATPAQFATPRRALQYDVEHARFVSVPVDAHASVPGVGPGVTQAAALREQIRGDLEAFTSLYYTARGNRDRFDDAFERDRGGLDVEELTGYGADELRPALTAAYRLFPLYSALEGAGSLRNALMRRVPARPPVAGRDAHEESISDSLGVFIERFSELAYQARISGLSAGADYEAAD